MTCSKFLQTAGVLLLTLAGGHTLAAAPWPDTTEILLWPNGAPGSEGVTAAEHYSPPTARSPHGHLSPVHYPSIFVFLPAKVKATGAAVLVLPGGGATTLTIDHEGRDIAKWLNTQGIAAFVVKYRLSKTPNFPQYTLDTSIADAQRALRLVRSRAAEWHVDPQRIGVMGFSAGGTVAAYAGLRFDAGKPDVADPIERVSSRPDFDVLVYPGEMPQPYTITKDTPPMLFIGTTEDSAHAVNMVKLYSALLEAKIPAEMHLYAAGAHGFALEPTELPVGTWTSRCMDWLEFLKLVPKK
ncbi:MAG TPA: alpha/beta hydrolase [Opitutales bacterium]|nr:alpha/beta hydrolase [Opitutales bacterium]